MRTVSSSSSSVFMKKSKAWKSWTWTSGVTARNIHISFYPPPLQNTQQSSTMFVLNWSYIWLHDHWLESKLKVWGGLFWENLPIWRVWWLKDDSGQKNKIKLALIPPHTGKNKSCSKVLNVLLVHTRSSFLMVIRNKTEQVVLALENNPLFGGVITNWKWKLHFPIKAHPNVLYFSYTTEIFQWLPFLKNFI